MRKSTTVIFPLVGEAVCVWESSEFFRCLHEIQRSCSAKCYCFTFYSLALAEIYLSMAYVFRRFDLELYETTRERDIDHVRDCFIGEVSPSSKGVRVRFTSPKAL